MGRVNIRRDKVQNFSKLKKGMNHHTKRKHRVQLIMKKKKEEEEGLYLNTL